jgi:hypothetical protein
MAGKSKEGFLNLVRQGEEGNARVCDLFGDP